MLSRALSLATVMLLIGGFAAAPVRAQNLEAGKSPSQIFSGTCAACHKGARGLLKTVAPGSLPGLPAPALYYQQRDGVGAQRLSGLQRGGRYPIYRQPAQAGPRMPNRSHPGSRPSLTVMGGRSAGRRRRKPPGRTRDGRVPQAEPEGRQGRNRLANPDAAKPAGEGQTPAAAAEERGPDGRRLSAKQRLSKRGKPGEELPKADTCQTRRVPMGEAAKSECIKGRKAKYSQG